MNLIYVSIIVNICLLLYIPIRRAILVFLIHSLLSSLSQISFSNQFHLYLEPVLYHFCSFLAWFLSGNSFTARYFCLISVCLFPKASFLLPIFPLTYWNTSPLRFYSGVTNPKAYPSQKKKKSVKMYYNPSLNGMLGKSKALLRSQWLWNAFTLYVYLDRTRSDKTVLKKSLFLHSVCIYSTKAWATHDISPELLRWSPYFLKVLYPCDSCEVPTSWLGCSWRK